MSHARIVQTVQSFALGVAIVTAVFDWRLAGGLLVLAMIGRAAWFVFWEAERAQDAYRADPDAPHAARRTPIDYENEDAA